MSTHSIRFFGFNLLLIDNEKEFREYEIRADGELIISDKPSEWAKSASGNISQINISKPYELEKLEKEVQKLTIKCEIFEELYKEQIKCS